jgi:hypothetical protein
LEFLNEYIPFLAGTLPFDKICYPKELEYFSELGTWSFRYYTDFISSKSTMDKAKTVITTFHAHDFRFELFEQA